MVFNIGRKSIKILYYSTWYRFHFGQIFPYSETNPNVTRCSEEYSAEVLVKELALIILGSQWFLVSAVKMLYYSTWYIFHFGQIFPFSETNPNGTRGSGEHSAEVLVKDLVLYFMASCF